MSLPAGPRRMLDALTSATLKHVRDEWWDDAFTDFLVARLKPRAGNRILDVGCGTGTAELRLSRLRLSQVTLIGIDLQAERTAIAERAADGHNMRASFAAADARCLPFPDGAFDSTFCVAVLQHVPDVCEALREFVRVTRAHGRILAVEPDNAARYLFSSTPEGMQAFAAARSFFDAAAKSRRASRPGAGSRPDNEAGDPRIGPQLPTLFAEAGIEPLEVQLFPVSVSRLGSPEPAIWSARLAAIDSELAAPSDRSVEQAGHAYRQALDQYKAAAASAGPGFVEIQSTLLFAVVGQRLE